MSQKLTDKQRHAIANHFQFGERNQTRTAEAMGFSRRTVQRVLLEKGLIKPTARVSRDKAAILEVVARHDLDAETLEKALAVPALTASNIHQHLTRLPAEQLSMLFYNITRQQVIQDIRRNAQAQLQAEQAAPAGNGAMQQEALV